MRHLKDPDTQVDRDIAMRFHHEHGRYPSKEELDRLASISDSPYASAPTSRTRPSR